MDIIYSLLKWCLILIFSFTMVVVLMVIGSMTYGGIIEATKTLEKKS